MMIVCVERRFGTNKALYAVEWLSDNGSAYISKDTLDTARALGLRLLFTPVRSPQSNGKEGPRWGNLRQTVGPPESAASRRK